jgi:hypothetical protein
MKSENKLEGALNFRAWKVMIDLILAKNKVLYIMKSNFMEPQFETTKGEGTTECYITGEVQG